MPTRSIAAAALLALAAPAMAQGFSAAPFHNRPIEVARAATLALMAARAEAVRIAPGERDEAVEALEDDATRVVAGLRRSRPEDADALEAALEALEDAASDEDARVAAGALGEVVAGVRAAPGTGDAAFTGAVAALLLVSEVGLAEAFEEAVEGDEGAYAVAFATLREVRALVDSLALEGDVAADAAELMGRLDTLMPTPEPPARMASDPEEGEVYAQALVGVLERATDADLYLGRDLARALSTIGHLAREGCAADDPAAGREIIAIAALYHEDALEAPLSVMAPEEQEAAEDAFDDLLEGAAPSTDACGTLSAAIDGAAARLFPQASR